MSQYALFNTDFMFTAIKKERKRKFATKATKIYGCLVKL